ncbi:MAG: deoxyribodipyrimidine photo-lyase [Candidatus Sumerlaeaceae bacterium]|nr:deoxyribodipyrimidine photo-lyase [Candidatus Sumerlaeaceae bacterium]
MSIESTRIHHLNNLPLRHGKYVLYWMQQSQRLHWNHALAYAIEQANELGLPVLICFGITPRFPEANRRHYRFMFDGLVEIAREAPSRGLGFVARVGSPEHVCAELAADAAITIVDAGYLRIQRQWRYALARCISCPLVEVESDVVVPVRVASPKEEFMAATLRPKIHSILAQYLNPMIEPIPKRKFSECVPDLRLTTGEQLESVFEKLDVDNSVQPVEGTHGGTRNALRLLDDFIEHKLEHYATRRSDPTASYTSGLSPYLHFGQISPLFVAWCITKQPPSNSTEAFLEELIIRRELAINFVFYNPNYDLFEGLPHWAQQTLENHIKDPRPYCYSLETFERAETHDPVWNACQLELVHCGTMHNYMRMYWGKKILEWTSRPERAFEIAIYLNNKYQLDGRDPNSFAGVAWCFGKHDRPWAERPIFGNVRYMNEAGLRRKFPVHKYIERVHRLVAQKDY